jgi:hypothetical protein
LKETLLICVRVDKRIVQPPALDQAAAPQITVIKRVAQNFSMAILGQKARWARVQCGGSSAIEYNKLQHISEM